MSPTLARALLLVAGAYLAAGLGFGLWVAARGAGRLDSAAAGAGWEFRLLVIPGAALLWPALAARLARNRPSPPEERTAHRRAAREAGP